MKIELNVGEDWYVKMAVGTLSIVTIKDLTPETIQLEMKGEVNRYRKEDIKLVEKVTKPTWEH